LGLIFDTESGREVEGIECEVNTPSKWVQMGLTNWPEREGVLEYTIYKNSDTEERLICCGRENLQMKK
jgi:hypothetical protein